MIIYLKALSIEQLLYNWF